MLLFQLIPVSLRQIPKTSRKVTNLSAESLTVPRAQLMAIFTSQITLRRSGAIRSWLNLESCMI